MVTGIFALPKFEVEKMSWVAILMGSESDWPTMQATTDVLEALEVKFLSLIHI